MCRLLAIKTVNTMALSIFLCLFQQPDVVLTSGMNLKPDFCLEWTTGESICETLWKSLLSQFHLATSGTKVTLLLYSSNYQQNILYKSLDLLNLSAELLSDIIRMQEILTLTINWTILRTQLNICQGLKATCDMIVTSAHVWSHWIADSRPLESQCN